MQPNLAARHHARFLGLGALLVAGVIAFVAMRPASPPAPDGHEPIVPIGRCYKQLRR